MFPVQKFRNESNESTYSQTTKLYHFDSILGIVKRGQKDDWKIILQKLRRIQENTHYPSRWGWGLNVIKNCDPFVFGPLFAMERMPGPSCFSLKFSSAVLQTCMITTWTYILTRAQCTLVNTWKFSSIDTFTTSPYKVVKCCPLDGQALNNWI